MTEGTSRYSIVEQLTQQKNQIADEVARIKDDISQRKHQATRAVEDAEEMSKRAEITITSLNARAKNVDEAIGAIKDISESASKTTTKENKVI